jgi:hypothetical protein
MSNSDAGSATPGVPKPHNAKFQYAVVVAEDSVVEAKRSIENRKLEFADVKQIIDQHSPKKITDYIGLVLFPTHRLIKISKDLAKLGMEWLEIWSSLRYQGLNIAFITHAEAHSLKFPPGHPRSRVVYIADPAMTNVYYTAAQFHRLAFEHKFAEAVKLLMALGATEISVKHISGWSREFAATVSAPLAAAAPLQPGHVSMSLQGSASGDSEILFRAHLKGTTKPRLVEGLVWYHHEPTWQQIAEGRLKFGLKDFSLGVRYEEDYGVNAGFKLGVEKSGLNLGGKFQDHQATIWQIDGKFA